ncbi:MAG: type II toxin-antitoxin system Phd/YefM family antitoxin [Desulfobacterales bacterium]|nr:type II toxin-antitoxin system Phd/YefM family antitoxin [Desulfobacterales bacterium]
MNTATVSDVGGNFRDYIKESTEHPVIIVEDGEPVAVLLSVSDKDDIEGIALAYNPKFRRLIDEADMRIEKTGGIKHNDFWESLEETENSEHTEI